MAPSYDSAAKSSSDAVAAALRALPSVDELLGRPRIAVLVQKSGRKLVTSAIRTVLSDARKQISTRAWGADGGTVDAKNDDELESLVVSEVENILAPSLRRVINATGVVLHTNLGRAPLARQAVARIVATAPLYNNLEYDLARGERGKRDAHTSRLLAELCGTEAAIVVNNNAAAVLLVLHALAKGEEVIVSRGELIEIGDGFRIPDIMAESGAVLREVGTTNRTGIRDYEDAINDRTRLLLRVHPSNFRVTGFTDRPSLEELVALGKKVNLPVYEDLGSGCLTDLTAAGKKGVVTNALYDFWAPARQYMAYHGGVRILSEAASASLATPLVVRPDEIQTTGLGYNPRERSWNYLEPWEGGTWRIGDIVSYQLIAFESLLYQAAIRREDLLRNFYQVGERAAARTSPRRARGPRIRGPPGPPGHGPKS